MVYMNDRDEVDLSKSSLITLEKNIYPNSSLLQQLHHGRYIAFVYDIEHDGTLPNGVGYPAVITEDPIEIPSKQLHGHIRVLITHISVI